LIQLGQICCNQRKTHCRIALLDFQDSANRRKVVGQAAEAKDTLGWIRHYATSPQDTGCSLNGLGDGHSLHRLSTKT
jgi:hypothetical protein